MKKKGSTMIHLEYLQKSTATLRGRQSVRATFKLSERSIDALSILACQLGIKQKTLFDQVVDDSESLRVIAQEFEDFKRDRNRVAKTYVISRKTLEILDQVARRYDTPRDALVEFSIERIIPLIQQEKEKHRKRKILLKELQAFSREGVRMLRRAEAALGADDPVVVEMLKTMHHLRCCSETVEEFVEKGNRMDDF